MKISSFHLGLIGCPLDHSLSPKIHKTALEICGLEGDYSLFSIRPNDVRGLKELLTRVRHREIHGLNITIPHKQNVIPLLDDLTPTARMIGAVNTIYLQENKLIGDNTDAPGFLADLKRFLNNRQSQVVNRKSSIVLGAGGSARAVVYALVNDGWEITISARRPKQARTLISQFPSANFRITNIEYHPTALRSLLSTLSLIVNTTPLGMTPNTGTSPWPADLPFPPSAAVYDLVYNPRETQLVKDAHAAGTPATTGLGMLIEQAALAFEIWTDHAPPRDVLWNILNTGDYHA